MSEQLPNTVPAEPVLPEGPETSQDNSKASKIVVWVIGLIAVSILVFVVIGFLLAFLAPGAAAGVQLIRDMLIVIVVLEGILIGAALIILTIQIARLINLLQNEIKPILEQTNDTVQTVKGTATFVSKNVADPVIRASGFVAWLTAILGEIISIFRIVK